MDEILNSLNEQQREAVVEKEGALLVLAGAGSGKTKVLTTRIVNLVKTGVNPYKILAVTFTNKAAKEMQERLSKMLGEDVVKKMWVGTFHNICGRILRFDIENYKSPDGRKWDRNYVIYDDNDTSTIIKNAIKKLNIDDKVFAPKLVKAAISNAKSKMQDAYTFSTRARDYRSQKIAEIYYEYEKQLMANNAIDFDDMLLLTVNLLSTNEEVRNKYHERFSHILVDEFQDTNISQYMLIRHLYSNGKTDEELKGRSLCVVGDVDQSIYSWRGADYKIILNFQSDYKNSKLIKLEKNYRSVATILDAANAIIVHNTERVSKNLYSTKGQGEKIEIYESQDEANEAYYIAKQIRNYSGSLNDCAVLYRTNAQSRAIEEALISQGIAYRMVGGLKFAILSTIGEVIALRIRTGGYGLKGFGVFPRMVVWFFLGAWIVMAMRIFGTGAPLLADYIFNADGAIAGAMSQPLSWNKFLGAFFISLLQNTAFAPVFMTLHKITDTHIMQCGGGLRAFCTPIKVGEIMAGMNWRVQWNFVFKKTIPFFWVPAHTVTFMLPGEYQVLFAAFLGVVLGIILAFAANK